MNSCQSFSREESILLQEAGRLADFRKVKLYLVGGALRDLYLGRKKLNPDFDFTLRKGAVSFARALAAKLKAGFVLLDKERGIARVVKKAKDKFYTLDFTDFKGKDLQDDLLHRDFTINSFALNLSDVFSPSTLHGRIIDPFSGRQDIEDKIIRQVSKDAFKDDPLRVLRAFSSACLFNFKIEEKTLKNAAASRKDLGNVSYERIRDELFKVFSCPKSFETILLLDKLKILEVIFPEIKQMRGVEGGPYHHLDVWEHTLESLKQLEGLFVEIRKKEEVNAYLDECVSGERSRRQLLKLGMLLHDIGKPKALRREGKKIMFHGHERVGLEFVYAISERLKLSNEETRALKLMVLWHLRPGYLGDTPKPTARAVFRYFRDAGKEAAAILLLSVADQRSTRGRLTTKNAGLQHEKACFTLIKEYFSKSKEKKEERLITGDDLIKSFKLEPSPLIGKVLKEMEELQAIKKIKDKKSALVAAARIIKGFLSRKNTHL
jgi:poly(A) polymerase